jgi:hypothetical protein
MEGGSRINFRTPSWLSLEEIGNNKNVRMICSWLINFIAVGFLDEKGCSKQD